MTSIYDFSAQRLDGREEALDTYRDKVLLIVNTASNCGFTPQYEGLETLYQTYHDKGFVVLGFPCNQFGRQEPGSAEDIAEFCSSRFNVTFPMFAKIDVNGDNTHPLYRHLKEAAPGLAGTKAIKWNFTKFLVNRQGEVIKRFASKDKPANLKDAIEQEL